MIVNVFIHMYKLTKVTIMKKTHIENYYATEDGNIYSDKTGTLKPMSIHTRKNGYQTVKVAGCSLVHRLVASAFIGEITGLTINHKDGNPTNNHISNLEIVTMKENIQHAWNTGLSKKGEGHSRAKFTDIEISEALETIASGETISAAAIKHGISRTYLNNVKNGRYRS